MTSSIATDWLDPKPDHGPVLHVDLDGYEGPLDLLLDLARRQKVDLAAISVLQLADQYLAFVEEQREQRIELAADYLVMAAWLAYLKSRLMLPAAPADEAPSGAEMAARLQWRLRRLEAMRQAATRLRDRPRLGIAVHPRGDPEPVEIARHTRWDTSLLDLLKAYATQRERVHPPAYSPRIRVVWSLQDARDRLRILVGETGDWVSLDACLSAYIDDPAERVTARASSFASSLELVRQGEIELRQKETFGPLMLRRRSGEGA
ncbi:ScpA family protein [Devosia sp. 1635]|uniref:segregation and condensation protein A n=1 Tax=Devosia sp. 1635 TaxID=2726066 RepID=UPI001567C14C|nr:ScpA family protein [Devosia sp. 1635]